jgi:hypothetical protein
MAQRHSSPPELIDVGRRQRSDSAHLPDGEIVPSDQAYVDVVIHRNIDMRQVSVRSFEDQTHCPSTNTFSTNYNHCLVYKDDIVWRLKNTIEYDGTKRGHPAKGHLSSCKMVDWGILQVKLREKGPLRFRRRKFSASQKRFYDIDTILQASAAAYETQARKTLRTSFSQHQSVDRTSPHGANPLNGDGKDRQSGNDRHVKVEKGPLKLVTECRNDEFDMFTCQNSRYYAPSDDVRTTSMRFHAPGEDMRSTSMRLGAASQA